MTPLRAQSISDFCPRGRPSVLYQRFLRLAIFVLIGASLASARDLALVSNKSNTVGTITLTDLVKVCKAQTNRWPDGKPVTFVMRAPSAPEMKVVLEKVYGMSQSELNGLIVTSNHGRPNHPAILVATSDQDLVNKMASLPRPTGVVEVRAITSSVAVVQAPGQRPCEPG